MTDEGSGRVFEDAAVTVDHMPNCAIPGYLVVRPRGSATSFSQLTREAAGALGDTLARVTDAIERVTAADRVYVLVFAELDRRLHVHLFPRTAWLLEAYWSATGTGAEPVNGPRLFEWARTTLVDDTRLPAGAGTVDAAIAALRAALRA